MPLAEGTRADVVLQHIFVGKQRLQACTARDGAAEDVVELLSGAIVRGEVTARTATDITLKTTIAGQAVVDPE